jgi:hypothetical protein
MGACLEYGTSNGQACLCSSGAECESGSCGYAVDTNDLPLAETVCEPNDGLPYDGCDDDACGSGLCCLQVSFGSTPAGDLCEKGCETDAQCDSSSTCQRLSSGTCSALAGSCVPIQ